MLAVSAMPAQQVPLPSDESALAEWPDGWASTYRRFEGFVAAKKRHWPAAGLQLVNAAAFLHAVPSPDPDTKSVTLVIAARGGHTLSTSTTPMKANDLSYFRPGFYSICAKSTGLLGYQHHFPIVWFESLPTEKSADPTQPARQTLRMVPAPGDGMAVWPNERLLSFLDFHVFCGRRYPAEIEKANQSVSPAVLLGIDDHGVVERETLPDAKAEALLQWRIYHDGKLVEWGAATGIARREMTQGPGNYLVLVGAEGPAGFFPVSNFLEFPLFPDGEEKPRVYPRDTDADGTPDFIQSMVASGAAGTADLPADQDSDNDGLTDIEEMGLQAIAPKDSQLLQLWGQWSYRLKNRSRWK